jgi:hypothetical protein
MFQKPRWKHYFYFVILSLSMFLTGGTLFGSSITYAQQSLHKQTELTPIDIVLDIDWTILNPTTEALAEAVPEGVFRHSTGVYRYSKHIVDFMMTLHSMPGVRVSFYSGGEAGRNNAVVKDLYKKINEKMSSNHFEPYKILSLKDLTKVSSDPKLRFGDRLKKDIARFFNPRYAVLVDDTKDFVLHGQGRNQLWLGKTYNDRPQYELAHLEKSEDMKYSAPNKKEWQRDLDKLLPVLDVLTKAVRKTRSTNVDFIENVDQINYLPRTCKSLF